MNEHNAIEMSTTKLYSFKPFKFEHVEVNASSNCVPCSRNGHRILCTNAHLYLYGGYSTALLPKGVCREVWKFNFATRKWKRIAKDVDVPREAFSSAFARGLKELFVYGGTGMPFSFYMSNKLYSIKCYGNYNITAYQISGEAPPPMYGQAVVLLKNFLYVIGGTTGFSYSSDIYRVNYTKERKKWTQIFKATPKRHLMEVDGEEKPEEPTNGIYEPKGRYRHEVVYDKGNIYVIGGGNAIESYSLSEIPVFNVRSRRWQKEQTIEDSTANPSYPPARRYHSTVTVRSNNNKFVYVYGGLGNDAIYNDLWRLELSTLQWKLINNNVLPKGLQLHSANLTHHGKMYIFGGLTDTNQVTNDVHCAWMDIPKLSEISWEALLFYLGRNNIKKSILKELNVPKRFLKRVSQLW